MASEGIVAFDKEFNVEKTYLSTERFTGFDSPGIFNQCITAEGEILNPETKSNLRAIQLKGNQDSNQHHCKLESMVDPISIFVHHFFAPIIKHLNKESFSI